MTNQKKIIYILVLLLITQKNVLTTNTGYGNNSSSSSEEEDNTTTINNTMNNSMSSSINNSLTSSMSNSIQGGSYNTEAVPLPFELSSFLEQSIAERATAYNSLLSFVHQKNLKNQYYIKFKISDLQLSEDGELQMKDSVQTYPDSPLNTKDFADRSTQTGLVFYSAFNPSEKYDIYGLAYLIAVIEHGGNIAYEGQVKISGLPGSLGGKVHQVLQKYKEQTQNCDVPDKGKLLPFCLQNLLKGVMSEMGYRIFTEEVYRLDGVAGFQHKNNFECGEDNFDCVFANCLTFRSASIPSFEKMTDYLDQIAGSRRIV